MKPTVPNARTPYHRRAINRGWVTTEPRPTGKVLLFKPRPSDAVTPLAAPTRFDQQVAEELNLLGLDVPGY